MAPIIFLTGLTIGFLAKEKILPAKNKIFGISLAATVKKDKTKNEIINKNKENITTYELDHLQQKLEDEPIETSEFLHANESLQDRVIKKYNIDENTNFIELLEQVTNNQENHALADHIQDEIVNLWSKHAPQDAIDWLQGAGDLLYEDENRKANLLNDALLEYAKTDLTAAELKLIELDKFTQANFIQSYIYSNEGIMTGIIENDIENISTTFSESALEKKALSYIFDEYATFQPRSALDALNKIGITGNIEEYEDQIYRAAFFLSESNQEAITESSISDYSESIQESITRGVTGSLVYKNPEEAYEWVTNLSSGKVKNYAIDEFLKADISIDNRTYLETSSYITNENQQLAVILRVLSEVRKKDSTTLRSFLEDSVELSNRNKKILDNYSASVNF